MPRKSKPAKKVFTIEDNILRKIANIADRIKSEFINDIQDRLETGEIMKQPEMTSLTQIEISV